MNTIYPPLVITALWLTNGGEHMNHTLNTTVVKLT